VSRALQARFKLKKGPSQIEWPAGKKGSAKSKVKRKGKNDGKK
jgi:hypothetical protein